jgi:pimeloyl-ACP methyl ester carboxylesterase
MSNDMSSELPNQDSAHKPSRSKRPSAMDSYVRPHPKRVFNRLLSSISPALAARRGFRQVSIPSRSNQPQNRLEPNLEPQKEVLTFQGRELAIYEWGTGPTVLFVHDWGSHGLSVGEMISPLVSAGYRVVSFDAPAHAASAGRATDLVQFAAALVAVARHKGPIHGVVGQTFGAAIALYAMREWGIEPGRVVLLSPFNHFCWFLERLGIAAGLTHDVSSRVREIYASRYSGRLDWARMSVLDMARTTDTPLLVIHDKEDPVVPFEHGQALAGASKRASLLATSGIGHDLVKSRAAVEATVRFLNA